MMFLTPWVTRLILLNLAAFFVAAPGSGLYSDLALVPVLVYRAPWTMLTYMFLHAGFWHLAFNMIGLLFFGPRLEARLGVRKFLTLYFLSGLGGAVFSLFFEPTVAVVGASAAVYGIVLAFAYYWPRETVLIWGILPVQIWALATFMVVASLFYSITGTGGNTAHFAHLGGLAVGFAYLRWIELQRRRRIDTGNAVPTRQSFVVPGLGDRERINRWKKINSTSLHSLNRQEVENLLEKLNASGASSLSKEEKAFLDRMSPK